MKILCFLLALGAVYTLVDAQNPFHVKFEWNYVNYSWPSRRAYEEAKDQGLYIPLNNVVSSMNFYERHIYLAIPRLKPGVPVTLASVSTIGKYGITAPPLMPFPDWKYQTVGNCDMLQSVQNMEIDPKGRMWVLDNGRVMDGSEESTLKPCGASLRIFRLHPFAFPIRQLRKYDIPATVADPRTADLHDIVLDNKVGGMAYISDADQKDPGIIVFSFNFGIFWKVRHDSMFSKAEGHFFYFPNKPRLPMTGAHIHALALSPASMEGNRNLYYAPLASLNIYSIPTKVLKNRASAQADIGSHVKNVRGLPTQTANMIMSNDGRLYYSEATNATIMVWDTSSTYNSNETNPRVLARDDRLLQWPAAFAIDNGGIMWCLSNRMHLALNNSMRIDEPNFRVLSADVFLHNYQYLENGSFPTLPEII